MKSAHLPSCREAAQFNNFVQATAVCAILHILQKLRAESSGGG